MSTRTAVREAGTCGTLDATRTKAPRLVLGLGMSGLAAAVESHFRNKGWEFVRAATAHEAGRYAHRHRATAVVLPVEAEPESGLLTCAKIAASRPRVRVVLVGPEDERLMRFARLAVAVGYIPSGCGTAAVARAVLGN